ncbi:MAG: Rab family GTPase [Pseudomonadota bacterium]
MTTLTSKICIVGDFAVGKTSVCERFVKNEFSEKYLTTVGVKIDTKEIHLERRNVDVKMVLWDVAGSDKFGDKEFAYLRGAAGYLYVADGTRSLTLSTAATLKKDIDKRFDDKPGILLVNKCDLTDAWEVSDELLAIQRKRFVEVFETSAKVGTAVDDALTRLAELVVDEVLDD